MLSTVIVAILTIMFVGALIVRSLAKREDAKNKAAWEESNKYGGQEPTLVTGTATLGVVVIGVALVIALFSTMTTTVSSRAVGIGTAFGKYTRTLDNGLQFKAPWESVEEFSTQVQYLDLDSTDGSDNKVNVAYKGGGDGSISLTVRWGINKENAQDLWKKYRTFEQVTNQLVLSSAKDSVNAVVGRYSPNDARDGAKRKEIAIAIRSDLDVDLKDDGIYVDSVSVKSVDLSEKTQASIEAIVQANANIERARSEKVRAEIDADTAALRESKGALTGPALQRYCLEVTNNWDAKKNGPLPATWNCLGASQDVIVRAK
jgi:regulator of protease activity HflC (stomatin/prohibitin superfamily)